ncbi:peptidoglycan-binding domain-containing protein [Escherichia coli]
MAKELSGALWVSRFPGSSSTNDLQGTFRASVDNFLRALGNARARVSISATYRPPARAYLMHWSWLIAHEIVQAKNVPAMEGVDIEWVHPTEQASLEAAQAMVTAYGMNNLNVAPALSSNHTRGTAINMNISWSGTLTIAGGNGQDVAINTLPQTGMNAQLQAVSLGYGVRKFVGGNTDIPHWSIDGH